MIANSERKDQIQRARGVISLLDADSSLVRAGIGYLLGYSSRYPMGDEVQYRQRAVEGFDRMCFEAALLGKLERVPGSLPEIFQVEDRIRMESGAEEASVERRLDFCTLAAVSAALNEMRIIGDQPKPRAELAVKPGLQSLRINSANQNPILYLDRARHIQTAFAEAGAKPAMDACVSPFVEGEKAKKFAQFKRDYPDRADEVHTGEFERIGLSADQVYDYFVRSLIRSAREGSVGDGVIEIDRVEGLLWEMEEQGFIPPADLSVWGVSLAFMNKVRLSLAKDAYRDPFGKPKAGSDHPVDNVITTLTRAHSFMNLRLPFFTETDRLSEDTRLSILHPHRN